ncbi:HAMP domain-containing sensor histidine kinase [uncultured Fusobacterium sp.]|uniref:sensor histidine kinase n=1 Tax=uncultured Fusobacterium sp. TaxID=159267 RepID=UPI002600549E|nr:HAMP domain-containing sensor histidine kinase [uncultured Fusobacterium sp.]
MRKIFYKIFLYFCLAAYLPLVLIYAFNFFYVDKYIIEDKKDTLIKIAENMDIEQLKKVKKQDIKYGENKLDVYLRYIDLNENSENKDFLKIFNRNDTKVDIRKMKLNEYSIKTVKLSSLTNHFFLIKKISDHEVVAIIGEIIGTNVVTGIMIGIYKQYSLFIIPILLIGSYIISKKFSEPIEILEKVSTQISNSDFTERVEIKSKNELESLGNNINKMATKLKQNIDELNLLNEKLKVELEEKEKLLETEKMFMRAIGHELKTPIAIINGYIEALQDNIIEGEEIAKTYNIIYEEGMSINKLVKDINEYLKLEFKNLELCYEKIQVRGLIKDSLKKYKLDIEQKNIKLIESYEDKELNTDIKLFNIVLNNLITNAITYVDERREINIELTDKSLIISNTSKEISEETIDKIFNPFYKIDDSRNRKYGGTGLGLSIVKNILEALNLKYSFSYDKEEKKVKFIIVF